MCVVVCGREREREEVGIKKSRGRGSYCVVAYGNESCTEWQASRWQAVHRARPSDLPAPPPPPFFFISTLSLSLIRFFFLFFFLYLFLFPFSPLVICSTAIFFFLCVLFVQFPAPFFWVLLSIITIRTELGRLAKAAALYIDWTRALSAFLPLTHATSQSD